MKFFATATIVLASLIALASPAQAANNPWESTFQKATQHADGTWTAQTTVGKKVVKNFEECRRKDGGFECRNQIEGGGTANVTVTVASDDDAGNGTQYAIFKPKTYRQYIKNGGNVWNVTDGGPTASGKKELCQQVGPDNCILVWAPLHDYNAAIQDAHGQNPSWRLL
jgi:hypothetical protein